MNERILLTLDIGNTNIVVGIFQDGKLSIRRRLSTHSTRTADEAGLMISMLCRDGGVDPGQIGAVAIASVSPKVGMVFGEMSTSWLQIKPYFVHGEVPGFVNLYSDPKSVGADRVCNAVAGFGRYGGPLLILDFGTAITIDVINPKGDYLGGVIMPGLETSVEALHRAAALLPSVRLSMPKVAIGSNTDESIRIGVMRGTVSALKGLIEEIRSELGDANCRVIATGGAAPLILPFLPELVAYEPDLVLEGIREIYERSLRST